MSKVTKRTRRINLFKLSMTLFILFGLCFLGSATLLKSYNVSLSATQQRLENDIKLYSEKKETLQLQVSELGSRPRIMAIANEEGLTKNQDNIVSVMSGDNGDE